MTNDRENSHEPRRGGEVKRLPWRHHLRREMTSGDWLPEIDGLRFIAIASVLLFHIQGQLARHYQLVILPPFTWFARMFEYGNRGVPLFFLISGFVLARPFAQHHLFGRAAPALRKYFLRRITRLEPPYIFNLAAVSMALTLVDHQPWRYVLPHLAASVVYMHYLIFHEISTINVVAWSLEVEVQFYILAPLLSMVFMIGNPGLRRFLLIAAIVVTALAHLSTGDTNNYTLDGEIQYFLAGLLLADLFLTRMAGWRHDWRWDLASLVGWPALFLLDESYKGLWLPFLALLLCIAGLRGVVMYAVLRNFWIAVIGGMCYTIYLWHAPILTAVGRILDNIPFFVPSDYALMFVLQAVVKTLVVMAVCLPLFVFIERPCMDPRWPRKLASRVLAAVRPPRVVAPRHPG